MGEEKFPVKPTENLERLLDILSRNSYPVSEKIMKMFDETPIMEVREVCLSGLRGEYEAEVNWLSERVKAYLEINDFRTAFMLLRVLAGHRGKFNNQILQLMVDVVESLIPFEFRYYLKDALVILCGKINYYPDLYNKRVREVFRKIIEKYYPGVYGSSEEEARLVLRVLFTIGYVKDTSFLFMLKEKEIDKEGLSHLMKYVSVCKDRLYLEGLRLLVIKHLETE